MSVNNIKIVTKQDAEALPVLKEKNGVVYFSYPGLEATGIVKHLFSTRLGGVSENEFSSMNLSFTRGDEEEKVSENYRRIAKILDCEPDDMVATYQTHTKNLRVIHKEDKGHGVTREKDFFDIDGLITNEPGVVLLAYFADCVPLYFVDPVNKVIALSHSGWKGTVQGMGEATLQKMAQEFGTNPENVHVAIGPSICQDCYEVSQDLVDAFEKDFWPRYQLDDALFMKPILEEMENDRPALFLSKGNGKYQLDLWLANKLVLLKSGITKEHMEITNVCTCCNPDLLFSHRASKGKRGNLCAFLALK